MDLGYVALVLTSTCIEVIFWKDPCSCCFLSRSTRHKLCYVRRHPSISSALNYKYSTGTMLKPSSHYHDSTKPITIPEVYTSMGSNSAIVQAQQTKYLQVSVLIFAIPLLVWWSRSGGKVTKNERKMMDEKRKTILWSPYIYKDPPFPTAHHSSCSKREAFFFFSRWLFNPSPALFFYYYFSFRLGPSCPQPPESSSLPPSHIFLFLLSSSLPPFAVSCSCKYCVCLSCCAIFSCCSSQKATQFEHRVQTLFKDWIDQNGRQ